MDSLKKKCISKEVGRALDNEYKKKSKELDELRKMLGEKMGQRTIR